MVYQRAETQCGRMKFGVRLEVGKGRAHSMDADTVDKAGTGKVLRFSSISWDLIASTFPTSVSKFTIKAPKDSAAWEGGGGSCRNGGDSGSPF